MTDLIILDTETTGVEAKRDSIIEIAAVKLSNGKIVGEFQTLVKPANPLNVTVSVLTGILPSDLEDAMDVATAGQKFLEFAGDLPIVGHNISFDIDFLKSHGIDPVGRSLDTLDLVITMLPKLPYHSMQYICEAYQFKNKPSHRAMSDVLATAELVNLLVHLAKNIPEDTLQKIKELSAKSDWEWSFIFDNPWTPPAPVTISSSRHAELISASPGNSGEIMKLDSGRGQNDEARNSSSVRKDDGKGDSAVAERLWRTSQDDGSVTKDDGEKGIQPGFNVYELPPEMPQMATNIALATNDNKSVLVVSGDIFHKQNWVEVGLNPYFGSVLQLDAERFNFLLNKPKIKSTDFRLIVKILLAGYPNKQLNPDDVYLTKDEFYLWEQKLTPFQFTPTSPNPSSGRRGITQTPPFDKGRLGRVFSKTVMNFASFYEVLENHSEVLKEKHIYLPQWIEFDEWATNKSAKMFTLLYVNAIVASRRDFVHDFVSDNKTADELFKTLNNLGSELNDWWTSVEELWGEQASGSPIEISSLLVADKTGKDVLTKAKAVSETLTAYLEKLKSVVLTNQLAQQKQIEHTANLLEHFNLLIRPGQSVKNYLNGYNGRVILNVVKQPVPNIWSRLVGVQSINLTIIIASNGILVNSKPDFISALLGEPIQVIPVRHSGEPLKATPESYIYDPGVVSLAASRGNGQAETPQDDERIVGDGKPKPITFISGLPDRNRDENYQTEIFEYIVKKVITPTSKTLVVFPNVAIMSEFFEMYKPALSHINLFSQNVAGNVEMLKDKLSALNSFTLLISGTNLPKFLPVLDGLDKTVFLTMPFDVPGSLSSVLAKDRFKNEFTDYALPKAIVKFRVNLAELYNKTNEIVILDSRLISTDWGLTVPKSLSGFNITKI